MDAAESEKLRLCLKVIRELSTLPSDILVNGKSASQTAHEYVMAGKEKRGVYKQAHSSKKRALRKKPTRYRTKKAKAKNVAKAD